MENFKQIYLEYVNLMLTDDGQQRETTKEKLIEIGNKYNIDWEDFQEFDTHPLVEAMIHERFSKPLVKLT